MGLVTDLLHVFLFIIAFIVIHIIVLHLADKRLSVNIRQRIVVDEGPVIKIKSLSRHRQRELVKQKMSEWEETNKTVSSAFHLKYKVKIMHISTGETDCVCQPILDWPESLTDPERWEYFRAHCSRDNLTAAEVTDCAYDSGGDIAVLIRFIYV